MSGERCATLALAAVGVACALGAAELTLRAADRAGWVSAWEDRRTARTSSIWMASEDPELIYRHRPGYVKNGTRTTERSGILSPTDVAYEPDAGVFRIALLGDSVAAGLGLAYEERMSSLLERELAQAWGGNPVEVLNFGVNGYSARQEAALLERHVERFAPDLLILQYCANDFHPTAYPTRWFQEQSRSYLRAYLSHHLDVRLLDGYPPAEYWERLYATDEEGWRSVEAAFERVARSARRRGIRALLVIFPVLSHEGWYAGDARGRHARVAERATAAGLEVLDLLPLYAERPVDELRHRPWDTFHPNGLGHRMAARAMAEAVAAGARTRR